MQIPGPLYRDCPGISICPRMVNVRAKSAFEFLRSFSCTTWAFAALLTRGLTWTQATLEFSRDIYL